MADRHLCARYLRRRDGVGLCGISIGSDTVERIISILDHLARVCVAWDIVFLPAESRMSAGIGADRVTFEIKEKTKNLAETSAKEMQTQRV